MTKLDIVYFTHSMNPLSRNFKFAYLHFVVEFDRQKAVCAILPNSCYSWRRHFQRYFSCRLSNFHARIKKYFYTSRMAKSSKARADRTFIIFHQCDGYFTPSCVSEINSLMSPWNDRRKLEQKITHQINLRKISTKWKNNLAESFSRIPN